MDKLVEIKDFIDHQIRQKELLIDVTKGEISALYEVFHKVNNMIKKETANG